jgi:uncharacterized protein (TIGR02246 family)
VTNFIGPLEDRVAIRELLDTYSDAVTRHDAAQWASVWLDSDDCRWMLPSMAEWAQFRGKAQIVDEWCKMMNQFHGSEGKHNPISQVTVPGKIVVDGDSATVRCFTTEFFVTPDGRTLHTKGQYDDVLAKRDGRWFFKDRTWTLFEMGDFWTIQTDKAEA